MRLSISLCGKLSQLENPASRTGSHTAHITVKMRMRISCAFISLRNENPIMCQFSTMSRYFRAPGSPCRGLRRCPDGFPALSPPSPWDSRGATGAIRVPAGLGLPSVSWLTQSCGAAGAEIATPVVLPLSSKGMWFIFIQLCSDSCPRKSCPLPPRCDRRPCRRLPSSPPMCCGKSACIRQDTSRGSRKPRLPR